MKKLFASLLCAAMAFAVLPISLDAAARIRQGNVGQISGTATVDGKPLPNVKVRLRNIDTQQLVGEMTANGSGVFSFTGLPVGNYVVETVDNNGKILGTSTVIGLTAAAMIAANIGVGTSAAALAGAAVGGGVAAGAGGALGLSTTALVVTSAAVVSGATLAVVAVRNDASPSQ